MNPMSLLPESALYLINVYAGNKFSAALLEDIKYKIVDTKLEDFTTNVEAPFSLYKNGDDILFEEYINLMITHEKKEQYLDYFQNCECCPRHTYTGKLRNSEKLHEVVYMGNADHPVRRCMCPCRHFRRFIVRSNMAVFN